MSVTSSDGHSVVCDSCGVVQLSAEPGMRAQYHTATCTARPNSNEVFLPYEPPAEMPSGDDRADLAAEPDHDDALWLTDGTAEPAPETADSAQPSRNRPRRRRQIFRLPRSRFPVWLILAAVAVLAAGLFAGLHIGSTLVTPGRADGKPSAGPAPGISRLPSSAPSAALPRRQASSGLTGSAAGATRPGGGAAADPGQAASPAGAAINCTTAAALGSCGPYSYPPVTGLTAVPGISIGNNVWNPVSGWAQTLRAASPGDWGVTASMPAGNTTVVSFPNLQADYVQSTSTAVPLSDYASIFSSFSETMNATSQTSAWATYEVQIGQGSGTSAVAEVMIENDLVNGSGCSNGSTATFGGSGGVPVQTWTLCTFGTELAWELTGGNEESGTVDILSMLNWLVSHGDLPQNAGIFTINYGWQIVSTGGQNENFQVSKFSITTTPS